MAAIVPTLVINTELSGRKKIQIFTVTPGSVSDTIDFSGYFTAINAVIPIITAGASANFMDVIPSISGTSVTLATYNAAGSNATNWTSATVTLVVIGEYN